jgi:hypothetical protein
MLGAFLSVLHEERDAARKAMERSGASEPLLQRFRDRIADLDAEIARVEARRG